jgi:hypothetical protein
MSTVVAFFLTHNFWYSIGVYPLCATLVVIPIDLYLDDMHWPVKPIH